MSTYTFPGRVPDLVQDVSLKRARTEVEIDGEKKDVIRVLPAGDPNLDAQGVADAMATAPDATVDVSSVLGRIAQLNGNLSLMSNHLGEISEAVYDPEESGTLLDNVQNNTAYTYDTSLHAGEINNKASEINITIGSKSDAQWVSGNGSLISLGKKIALNGTAIYPFITSIQSSTGNTSAAEWSGTGDGSLVAIAKRTSNDTHAAAEVLGTKSDALVSYAADGSINGRLKALSNYTADARAHVQDIKTYLGSTGASAWTGTGSGTLNAIAKRTSNDTNATATATGTQSDAAWDGQAANATIIALLKGIYNKL